MSVSVSGVVVAVVMVMVGHLWCDVVAIDLELQRTLTHVACLAAAIERFEQRVSVRVSLP